MTRSRRFLLEYGLLDDSRRAEFTLATVRFMLAGVSLVAIYLEPTEPRRYAPFIYRLLSAYVVYSMALLAVLRFREQLSEPAGLAIHAGDVLVAFVMTLFTEGPTSPFFVFFGFGHSLTIRSESAGPGELGVCAYAPIAS